MAKAEQLITEHLDVWTSAVKAKSSAGQGSNKKIELYGIRKLRQLILELAVRGSLTPSETQWSTAQFGEIFDIQGGSQPPKSEFISEPQEGYVRLLQIRDLGEKPVPTFIPENLARRFCNENDILIGRYGASVGKIFRGQKGSYNVALAKLIWRSDTFTQDFLISWLKSEAFQKHLEGASRSAQAGFNKGDLATIQIQFPPLAEQHRIVGKVDELMALCDQLEQEQESNLETHETLVSTLLNALTSVSADASQLAEAWQSIQSNFDILFTTESSINKLKKTILQLAVMGKLVPGLGANTPRKSLGEILAERSFNGISRGPTEDQTATEVLRISAGTSSDDFYVDETDFKHVNISAEEIKNATLKRGDLLACRYNGNLRLVGRFSLYAAKNKRIQVNPDKLIRFRVDSNFYDSRYVCFAMNAPQTRSSIEAMCSTTAGNIGLSAAKIKTVQIPTPPLPEQHQIAAKVDELMIVCDQLNASLASAQDTQLNLADSLVEQAIN